MIYEIHGDGKYRGRLEWDSGKTVGPVEELTGQEFYISLMYLAIEQGVNWSHPHPLSAITKKHYEFHSEWTLINTHLLGDCCIETWEGEILARDLTVLPYAWSDGETVEVVTSSDSNLCGGCDGKGRYVSFTTIEDPCRTCGGVGRLGTTPEAMDARIARLGPDYAWHYLTEQKKCAAISKKRESKVALS